MIYWSFFLKQIIEICKEYFEMKKSCCGFASLMIFVCTGIIITVGYSGEKSGYEDCDLQEQQACHWTDQE